MNLFKRTFVIVLLVFGLAAAGLFVFLATWDIPAPKARIEKVIPNDRLPR
ncbi:MAG: hypothetical protein HY057_10135 [Rhodospirillales bacterium]|nr:hypothetical protein [Rhodospirillales bacterium]